MPKEKLVAKLTINDYSRMTTRGQVELRRWLRGVLADLRNYNNVYHLKCSWNYYGVPSSKGEKK